VVVEYDVLGSLGKRSTKQALKTDKGKSYDVLFCDDGAGIHFDVSDVFGSLKRRF
jgi:MinD-like ATPase involved in chromosome partitioning or flagellar assembly